MQTNDPCSRTNDDGRTRRRRRRRRSSLFVKAENLLFPKQKYLYFWHRRQKLLLLVRSIPGSLNILMVRDESRNQAGKKETRGGGGISLSAPPF